MLIDYLQDNNISIYELSKDSGVAYSTLHNIATGKQHIDRCSVGHLKRIADCLSMNMDRCYEICRVYTANDFELFKSNVCHDVKRRGDLGFIGYMIESDDIMINWENDRKEQAMYLLSMLDYLSNINDIPLANRYDNIRQYRIEPPIVPLSVNMSDVNYDNSIKEFRDHGIIEGDIRDVC